MIIHINGMPGVGKFTVAKLLAERLDARLIDNHLLVDLATSVCERGGRNYSSMIKKLMAVVLEQAALTRDRTFVFTNALAAESAADRERFEQIRQFAESSRMPFVQVLLTCEPAENKRRLVSENRRHKGKLMDSNDLADLYQRFTIYHPPAEHALTIDSTSLSAEAASERIRTYVEDLS